MHWSDYLLGVSTLPLHLGSVTYSRRAHRHREVPGKIGCHRVASDRQTAFQLTYACSYCTVLALAVLCSAQVLMVELSQSCGQRAPPAHIFHFGNLLSLIQQELIVDFIL
jgi:hypothetical protein